MPNVPTLDGFVIGPAIAAVFVAALAIYSASRREPLLAQPERKPSAMNRAAGLSSSDV
jgi:hypothetical protein